MQGTVASFDARNRAGTVYLDDGTELAFDTDAFVASGLRLLRVGQRVRIDQDGAGRVTSVSLPTFPPPSRP